MDPKIGSTVLIAMPLNGISFIGERQRNIEGGGANPDFAQKVHLLSKEKRTG